MKILFFFLTLFCLSSTYGQLGFCEGSKGDPIFHEDFGQGSGTGDELGSAITSYTFVRQDPQDGEYTISDDIGNQILSWHDYLPSSTTSGGRALIVNADFTAGRFYRKDISGLCEKTTYEFSAFLMNIYDRNSNVCENGGIPNNVKFEIWDQTDSFLIASGNTPSINSTSAPQWQQFALTFQTEPGQDAVILKMFNNGQGGCGNDLAIDDIIFRSCGDLTTVSNAETGESELIVCEENSPVSVSLQANADSSVYEEQFYQWQVSNDGETWRDVQGAITENFQSPLIDTSVFYRVLVAEDPNNLNSNFCSSASDPFELRVLKTPASPVSEGDVFSCQNEPIPDLEVTVREGETVNWFSRETGGDLLAENTTRFRPEAAGTYYAEAIKIGGDCAGSRRAPVTLTITSLPEIQDETHSLCPDSVKSLSAGVTGFDYRWSTGETTETINISSPGTYSVDIITSNDCYVTKQFSVSLVENAEIQEVVSNEENIEIIAVEPGDFQYSLDGINYQPSPVFNSVPGGVYTAYMKDNESCKIVSLEFAHIVIPKMISPNNDGYNDVFQLKGIEFLGASEIHIFNRYGRLLKKGNGEGFKWDGTVNTVNLPADDYWYRIRIEGLPDKTGHFSLIR